LIEKWHGRDRLSYAVTPRFAITSSEEQLRQAGRLLKEYPDVYLHTHLAENEEEVAQVAKQFPWSRSYLDVYERFELVRERSVFAHCIHMGDDDRKLMARKGAAMAFCPSSNLFLGSGLFDMQATRRCGIHVGVGSDVAGGTSLSMLRTLSDAYKVLQLQEQPLCAFSAFHLVTLGSARALSLEGRLGNFTEGKEADFVVLDPSQSSILKRRLGAARDIAVKLFSLCILGDKKIIDGPYLVGKSVHLPYA
jgi:guanine deaminase